jgi:hypothetical protein
MAALPRQAAGTGAARLPGRTRRHQVLHAYRKDTASDAGSPTTLPSHSAITAGIHHAFRSQTGGRDQTEAASERVAVAMECIASLLEEAHTALRQRLQGTPETSAALPD